MSKNSESWALIAGLSTPSFQGLDPQWLVLRGHKDQLIERLTEMVDGVDMPPINMTAGQALEARRKQYQFLTKSEFAQILGMSRSRYSRILAGTEPISLYLICKAYAVGVQIEPLLQATRQRSTF